MTFSKLASPLLVTGPRDDLVAADVYGLSATNPINSIQLISVDLNPGSFLGIAGGKAMLSQALGAIKTGMAIAQTLSSGNILARLDVVAGLAGTSLTSIGSSVVGQLSSSVSGLIGNSPLLTTVGNTVSKVAAASFGDTRAMGSLIGDLSAATGVNLAAGVQGVADLAGTAGMLAGVVQRSGALGMMGSFGEVAKFANVANYASNEARSVLNGMAMGALPSVVQYSDVASLASMGSLLPNGSLLNMNPTVVSDFCSAYQTPTYSTSNADRLDQFGSITSAFNSVSSAWNTVSRVTSAGSTTINNMMAIANGSLDLKRTVQLGAMLSNDASAKNQLFGIQFPTTNVTSRLASTYPQTAFTSSTSLSGTAQRLSSALGLNQTTQAVAGVVLPSTSYPAAPAQAAVVTAPAANNDPNTITTYYPNGAVTYTTPFPTTKSVSVQSGAYEINTGIFASSGGTETNTGIFATQPATVITAEQRYLWGDSTPPVINASARQWPSDDGFSTSPSASQDFSSSSGSTFASGGGGTIRNADGTSSTF